MKWLHTACTTVTATVKVSKLKKSVNNFHTNQFGISAGTATWITLDGAILLFHLFVKFLNASAATSVV